MTIFNLLKTTPLVSILLFVIAYLLSPFFTYQLDPGGFNDQRFLQLSFSLICLLTAIAKRHYRQSLIDFMTHLSLPVLSCLLLFFIAALISSIIAPDTVRALQEVGLYAIILITTILLSHELRQLSHEQLERILILSFSTFLVIYSLYFVIYYVSVYVMHPERFLDNNRWMPNFYNVRSFNQVEAWLLPAFFWLCFKFTSRPLSIQITVYFLTALWWVMLCYSLGRGISLALFVATLGMLLLFRRQSFPLLKPALVTFVLGIILYALLFVGPPYWLDIETLNGKLPLS
jgi:hypothetical protein